MLEKTTYYCLSLLWCYILLAPLVLHSKSSLEPIEVVYHLDQFSNNHVFSKELKYYQDADGSRSFEKIQENEHLFQANSIIEKHQANSAYWLKISLCGHKDREDQYLFDFTANHFNINWNHIEAWLVNSDGNIEHHQTGSSLKKENKPIPSTVNLLQFDIKQQENVTLYVRLSDLQNTNKQSFELSFTLLEAALNPGLFVGYPFKGIFPKAKQELPFNGNRIVNHELFVDQKGTLPIKYIEDNWENLPRTDLFTTQHKPGLVYWMKMRFHGTPYLSGAQIFHISATLGADHFSFDYIDTYVSDGQGGYHHQRTGDHISLQERPYHFWANFIQLNSPPSDTIDLFVRMEGADRRFLMSNLLLYHIDPHSLFPQQVNEAIEHGVFFAILGIQALFFLLLFTVDRIPVHFYFSVLLVGLIMSLGFEEESYFSYPLLPEWRDYHVPLWFLGLFINQLGGLKFNETYFDYPASSKVSKWIIPSFLAISILVNLNAIFHFQYVEITSNNYDSFLPINAWYYNLAIVTHLGSVILSFLIAIFAKSQNKKERTYFFIAFVPLIIAAILNLARPIGVTYGMESWENYALYTKLGYLLSASIISMTTCLALSIGLRTNRLKEEKKKQQEQKEQLEELDRMKTTLFANISHEFRTPLTVIKGMTNHIVGNEKEKGLIQRNADNLLHLINQILDISKLENQSFQLNYIQGDITLYIRYICESLQSLSNNNNVLLQVDSKQLDIIMDYDQEKMQQVIDNLLSNAIKYSPPGGRVTIQSDKVYLSKGATKLPFLQLSVSDTGKGIAPKELDKIFDRFYQVNDPISKVGGTGIGLALVKDVVKLMNGTIQVKSKLGQETTFVLQLPITNNAEFKELAVPTGDYTASIPLLPISKRKKSSSNSFINKPHLLIIEDNADVVEYLTSCLQENYQLQYAYNGRIGIQKAIEEVPDIIVSDVMMPEKNGFEVCDALKQATETSHIPIILLTAKATIDDKIRGLQYGADAYIAKPFHPKELLVRAEKLIENRKHLQAKYSKALLIKDPIAKTEDIFLKKAQEAILENLDTSHFGPDKLAHKLGTSRTQLHRKLKALTNISTSNYIKKIRMQEAKRLLRDTEMTISEVAYAVGSSTPAYFSTNFSKEFNCSPSNFRKQIQQSNL